MNLKEGFIDLSAEDTKTSEPRRIYFNEALRTLFKELGKIRRIRHQSVFTYRGKPLGVIRKAFYEACATRSTRTCAKPGQIAASS